MDLQTFWNMLVGGLQTLILFLTYRKDSQKAMSAEAKALGSRIAFGRYGLLLAMGLLTLLSWLPILINRWHSPELVTVANIEAKINQWAMSMNLGLQRRPEEKDVYFRYLLTLPNVQATGSHGRGPAAVISISRQKNSENSLIIQTRQDPIPASLARWNTIERSKLASLITIELARTGPEFTVNMEAEHPVKPRSTNN